RCSLRYFIRLGISAMSLRSLGPVLALVDPALHSDVAERRARLREAVIDIRAERLERDAPEARELASRHLGPAESARELELHPEPSLRHRRGHRLLHRAPERRPLLELLRDVFRDEIGVQLGNRDLLRVDRDLLLGQRLELFL